MRLIERFGNSSPESPAMTRFRDRLIFGVMIAFQLILLVMASVPVLTHQPGSGNPEIYILCSGWMILLVAYQRQQSRIENLEQHLAESKLAPNS